MEREQEQGPNPPGVPDWQAAAAQLAGDFRAFVRDELNTMQEETARLRQQATELARALADERAARAAGEQAARTQEQAARTQERAARAKEQEAAQAQRQLLQNRVKAAEASLAAATKERKTMATSSRNLDEKVRQAGEEHERRLNQLTRAHEDQQKKHKQQIASLRATLVPKGAVFAFQGTTLPEGYEWASDLNGFVLVPGTLPAERPFEKHLCPGDNASNHARRPNAHGGLFARMDTAPFREQQMLRGGCKADFQREADGANWGGTTGRDPPTLPLVKQAPVKISHIVIRYIRKL
jgi:hypothetical protein